MWYFIFKAVRALVLAKIVVLGILFLNSFTLALRATVVANVRYFLSSIVLIVVLYRTFGLSFLSTSLSLLKPIGIDTNLCALLLKLLN